MEILSVTTDEHGAYAFPEIPAGTYTVKLNLMHEYSDDIDSVNDNEFEVSITDATPNPMGSFLAQGVFVAGP